MGLTATVDVDISHADKPSTAAVEVLLAVKAWELDAQWGYSKSIAVLRRLGFDKEADIIQEYILDDEFQHEQILNELIRRLDPNVLAQQDIGRKTAWGDSGEWESSDETDEDKPEEETEDKDTTTTVVEDPDDKPISF